MSDANPPSGLNLRRMAPLLVVGIVAVLGFVFLRDYLSFQTLADNREKLIGWRDANFALVALIYVLVYIVVVAFSLPGGAVMTLTGGFLFGLAVGTPLTVIGATLGATAIFLAAKTGLGDALHNKLEAASSGGMLTKMEQGLRENEISYLFAMRLIPAIPFFVANLAPAFLGVKLRNYALTTFFGIIPGTAIYTWVGSGLGEVFERGETPNLGIIFEPHILGPILGLAALSLLPIIVKKFRRGAP